MPIVTEKLREIQNCTTRVHIIQNVYINLQIKTSIFYGEFND